MGNERILNDALSLNDRWSSVAREALAEDVTLKELTEREGQRLVDDVTSGQVSVDDLRQGLVWVNALNKELVDKTGSSDLEQLGDGDHFEGLARQIAHKAGKIALNEVKSKHRRGLFWRRSSGFMLGHGMGLSERHDYFPM